MNITINWLYLLAAAFGVAGVMEYIKGFAKSAPSWIWHAILPVVCAGVALAGDGGVWQIASNAVFLLALTQLAYDLVISAAIRAIKRAAGIDAPPAVGVKDATLPGVPG